ncbi:MAG: enoyl-CoA hydratase, partial [Actinomycetota bacterium]|nr:enoyl-CoA hydratase [Actinomycetota bacterium]
MADEALVLTEARGPVLVITINRPEARNSINKATAEAIGEALDRLDADSNLSVGVLTGAGKG